MNSSSRASAGVIVAAVAAILCALFLLLIGSMTFFAFLFVKLPPPAAELPLFLKTFELITMAFMVCLSIFGIITGIGLIYLRKWARISILIWGGVFAFFASIGIPFAFLLPKFSPPGSPQLPEATEIFIQWMLVFIYGVPLVIGVWWLILFN